MPKTIKMSLNRSSIDRAIQELKDYKAWVERKSDELTRRLATIGAMEASVRFNGAYYDSEKDGELSVEKTQNGFAVVARGKSIIFIEFGAGVYFNGSEPYTAPRPPGVVGIGEYGKGHGKQDTWGFYDESGELVLTHGTPAAMPMYHAARTMEREVLRIAREVFR